MNMMGAALFPSVIFVICTAQLSHDSHPQLPLLHCPLQYAPPQLYPHNSSHGGGGGSAMKFLPKITKKTLKAS